MAKNATYLIIGIVATILYWVLYSTIAESYCDGASDFFNKMYNVEVLGLLSGITILTSWGGAAIYYYVINSVKFSRWYHWLCILAIVAIVTPLICYGVNQSFFDDSGYYGFEAQEASFETLNFFMTIVLFIVASFSMRWWSTNCRHTPIPQ